MNDGPYPCPHCPIVFDQPGTVHGQPAGLWALLEHLDRNHKET